MGGRSIQLARVFGIRVGVHPSWFVVLFLIIWFQARNYGAAFPDDNLAFALATASALLFFASVVLHELGHAMGLAHTPDTRQLMATILPRTVTDLQSGDRAGLTKLGRTAGCIVL